MTSPAQPKTMAVHTSRLDAFTADVRAGTWTATWAITGTQPVAAPKPTEALIGALAACMPLVESGAEGGVYRLLLRKKS
ncbi:MAG: hypothetical protein ABI725_08080 [Chloroflexota bacterium]